MSDFKIKGKYSHITEKEQLWGFEPKIISIADIEALLKGERLYGTINWEYAFTIKLDEKLYQEYKEKIDKILEILGDKENE